MLALLLLVAVSVDATENNQWIPDMSEFVIFKDNSEDLASGGVPICYADEFEGPITNNAQLVNTITKFNRGRFIERTVHPKGTGAFGYFEVTHDMSHICKADFLKRKGMRTPVAVRFSGGTGERGSSDFARDSHGFAVKFYTEEGNLDFAGFHTEMYFYKDPLHFSTVIHAVKRMPDSNLYDFNSYWDAVTQTPAMMNFIVNIYADKPGIPLNYRHMPGFPIHTYQVENQCGACHWIRIHLIPDCGVKTLKTEDAQILGATDPNYAIKDLYEAIAKGNFPSWTVYLQIVTPEDLITHGSNIIFDPTRKLNADDFPLHPLGKLVLNKNAINFNDEIEPMIFGPGNVVPGIIGAPDKIYKSRILAYRDAQLHRVGKNHNKIPVNCPLHNIFTYNRDGMPPVGNNDGDAPNYYPNSFNGPQPRLEQQYNCTINGLIEIVEEPADNTDQVVEFYNSLTEDGRQILCENFLQPLKIIKRRIQKKVVKMFTSVVPNLGWCIAKGLNITSSNNY